MNKIELNGVREYSKETPVSLDALESSNKRIVVQAGSDVQIDLLQLLEYLSSKGYIKLVCLMSLTSAQRESMFGKADWMPCSKCDGWFREYDLEKIDEYECLDGAPYSRIAAKSND